MAVEDCECIAGVPPSEKLAALFCVFKAISEGTPAIEDIRVTEDGDFRVTSDGDLRVT